jgi:hypothetical protein
LTWSARSTEVHAHDAGHDAGRVAVAGHVNDHVYADVRRR